MQNYFYELSQTLFKQLTGDEQLLLNFEGEDSDFVRFNNNKIRQSGRVSLRSLCLDLIEGKRHAEACVELSGDMQQDIKQLTDSLKKLREQRAFLPEDPYLSFATEINNSEYHHDAEVINSHAAIEQILQAGRDLDLVGIFANGSQYVGFANSMGQRNWHSSANFNFDWSCYLTKDKAVKSNYAGFEWRQDKLLAKIENCKRQLAVLAKPAKTIEPGSYRAYLAPSAVDEIMGMLSWGGFGLKSHRTKSTALIQMLEEDPSLAKTLASTISIREHHARGLAPVFTDSGFIKPEQVQLIENGRYKDCLVNPRSAMEYDSVINAGSEYPCALDLAAGDLAEEKILSELGTGLYINNLWYLNFSDRNACQLTGMTRFACFWVENGEIQAPLNVMRFDDSIYDLFGTNLLGLTSERELILDSSTYGQRSNSSIKLPGVLVKDMCFTL